MGSQDRARGILEETDEEGRGQDVDTVVPDRVRGAVGPDGRGDFGSGPGLEVHDADYYPGTSRNCKRAVASYTAHGPLGRGRGGLRGLARLDGQHLLDRKSTRLNSSH